MIKGIEYLEEHKLLIHHITKDIIFDEISYILALTALCDKALEVKPKYLMILVKTKKNVNYDGKFVHWIENFLVPSFHRAGIVKVGFVLPFSLKEYKGPQPAVPFEVMFFSTITDALNWFGFDGINHITGFESHSVEIPL